MGDVARLYRQSGAERWQVTPEVFADAVARSETKAFSGRSPSPAELHRYRRALHLSDLALACGCLEGNSEAWDYFVAEYRPTLYRAADAVDRTGAAREIADSIYGELFSKSLFRYFHGRSSLATWLRSLLSQRYVDRFRETRRLAPLSDDDDIAAPAASPPPSPDRSRFVGAMQAVLAAAIAALEPRDRLRLRCYYAEEMTLAQIGRVTRESEATVSRHLARTRATLRDELKQRLKREHGFSDVEIADCISSVVDDAGTLDLAALLPARSRSDLSTEALAEADASAKDRKNSELDRSKYEGVS